MAVIMICRTKNENYLNHIAICYEKDQCGGECLHSERKVLSPDLKKLKTLKALKLTVGCVYRPSLEYGNERCFQISRRKRPRKISRQGAGGGRLLCSKITKLTWVNACFQVHIYIHSFFVVFPLFAIKVPSHRFWEFLKQTKRQTATDVQPFENKTN